MHPKMMDGAAGEEGDFSRILSFPVLFPRLISGRGERSQTPENALDLLLLCPLSVKNGREKMRINSKLKVEAQQHETTNANARKAEGASVEMSLTSDPTPRF